MKKILPLILLGLLTTICRAQTANPNYNKTLADSLGADEYGMKPYILVILKTGPNKSRTRKKSIASFKVT